MNELLHVAVLNFCGHVGHFSDPISVLRGLDRVLHNVRMREALHVLGAWYWPHNPTNPGHWKSEKTFFMLDKMNGFKDEYLSAAAEHGISSMTLIARRKSAPYTLTEAMRELRPTGDERWLIELFRKHGVRDGLYCPFTRWTLAYWSSQRVDLPPEIRGLLGMAATAAIGRIEKIKRYPEMTAKEPLSTRELEVLQLASTGLTASEIAGKLGLSTKTVQHYIERASAKLEAKNTVHAVAEAIRQGLIV